MAARETRPVASMSRRYQIGGDVLSVEVAAADKAVVPVFYLTGWGGIAFQDAALKVVREPSGGVTASLTIHLGRVDAPQPDPLASHVDGVAVNDDSRADGAGLGQGRGGQQQGQQDRERAHGGEDA